MLETTENPVIGLLGDIHGDFKELLSMMKTQAYRVDAWLQVGDLGGEGMEYPDFPSNFYFIQGNHENWDYIRELSQARSPQYIPNGAVVDVQLQSGGTVTVAGLGGNYSSNFFMYDRVNLPQSRYRHYLQGEIESLKKCNKKVDIFLSHEAPAPYMNRGRQTGQETITQILTFMRPKIHVFGHHHYHTDREIEGIRSVGLNYGMKEPLFYTPNTGEIKRL